MIKVLFIINSLGGGGAERVLVNLVNNMDFSRFAVKVQTIFGTGVNYDLLDEHVTFKEGKHSNFHGISAFIKILSKNTLSHWIDTNGFDIVIAYMHGVPTKILWNYKGKKIAWLHSDMKHSSLPKFFFRNQITKCFKTFDRIVGVSDTVCESFKQMYGLGEKLITIYNTNDVDTIRSLAKQSENDFDEWVNFKGFKLITVGRLGPEKGYSRLIRICNKLKLDKFYFKLLIIGTGTEEDELRSLINDNNLSERVILAGYNSNPYYYMNNSDLFVCSSYFEGMSTVISEAVILGTPVITTEVSGAREVLGNSEYGLIVNNDEGSLYEGLKDLLSHPDKIEFYKNKAIERAPIFDTKATVSAVEKLIEEVVNE